MLGKLYNNLLQVYGMDMDMNSHSYSNTRRRKLREKHYIKVVLHYSERDKALDRAGLCNCISVMQVKNARELSTWIWKYL